MMRTTAWTLALLLLAGCAVRLGGPEPVHYRTLGVTAGADVDAAAVAAQIEDAEADVVLLSAPRDSAFFAEVARLTGLSLSGPGDVGATRFAFLAGEALGDTTVALPIEGGGEVLVHDALYRVDKSRYLDLMALRVEDASRAREVVRALLRYVATDVLPEAATVIAIEAASPLAADSIAGLISPAFLSAADCMTEAEAERARAQPSTLRLLIGPEARVTCEEARVLAGPTSPLLAEVVVRR